MQLNIAFIQDLQVKVRLVLLNISNRKTHFRTVEVRAAGKILPLQVL